MLLGGVHAVLHRGSQLAEVLAETAVAGDRTDRSTRRRGPRTHRRGKAEADGAEVAELAGHQHVLARLAFEVSPERVRVVADVESVGHIVIRVSDLVRALEFYSGVLGLREVARRDFGEGPMVFLSTVNSHHDIALVESGDVVRGNNLHHFALKVGDSLATLAEVRSTLAANDVAVHMALDHHVSQGLYISDCDGNLIEL